MAFLEKPNEGRRKQLVISDVLADEFVKAVAVVVPHVSLSDAVFLISEAGCKRQSPHCDWDPVDPVFRSMVVPCGVVWSLQNHTFLVVWPGSWRLFQTAPVSSCPLLSESIVEMNAGDVLIFRGDLVHAGNCYADRNIRMHAYGDVSRVARVPDYTFLLEESAPDAFAKLLL